MGTSDIYQKATALLRLAVMNDMILVAIIVVVAMGFFAWGRFRIDLVAICVLIALLAFGLIPPELGLAGFASSATGTIAAMFVISAGLARTGAIDWLARRLDRLAGSGESRLLLVLGITLAALSAFIVNTATVAVFIPVAVVLARKRRLAPSRILIPLSYASQFGGVCTLIGTSTNLIINAFAVDAGLRPFGIFEFAPLGLVMVLVGMGYLMLLTPLLLPKRRGEEQQVDKYRLADYLAEYMVTEKSALIGKTWYASAATKKTKVELANFIRGDKPVSRPAHTVIREGDVLLLHGSVEELIETLNLYALKIQPQSLRDERLRSHNVKLVEALVPPRSRLINRTLNSYDFFRRHRAVVLGVQRRGKSLRERIGEISLAAGDTLLLQVHKDGLGGLLNSENVIVVNELTDILLRKRKVLTAVGILVAVVALAASGVVPILLAGLIGGVGMVVGRCISIEEAYSAIDWKIIMLLGGVIPLGMALERSGAAAWLADQVLAGFADSGPLVILALLYLVTAVFTEAMSNNAAAALLAPIALTLAVAMDVDPRPFLVAIAFSASTSFATPVGYQTNTMVYAPGGYKFTDFTRIGVPLNLLFWGLAVLLIPRIWPF